MLEFRVLGALELDSPAGTPLLSVLSQPKRVALLACLALATPRGFLRRDTLLAWFWPDADDARARRALNQALYHLRQSLGEEVLRSRNAEEVGLDWSRIRCDAVDFRDALRERRVDDALALYRGDLLPGFHADTSPEFEQWLDAERAALRTAAAGAAVELAARAEQAGDAHAALHYLRRARAIEPERESHVQQLIGLLQRSGDDAGALAEYERYAARLATELDTAPSAALGALAERIRRSAPPASPPATAAPPPSPAAPPPAGPLAHRLPRSALIAAGLGLLAVALGVAYAVRSRHDQATEAMSLAVLPLASLSPGTGEFADGVTVELIHTLEHVPRLRVPGRTASFAYQRRSAPLAQIASELDVQLLLEGEVRQSGDTLVASVRLTNPATGRALWSNSQQGRTARAADLQRKVARQVAALLTLAAPGWPKSWDRDPAIIDLYLQALLSSETAPVPTGSPLAAAKVPVVEVYRAVLERAPDFGLARAGLAYVLARSGDFDGAIAEARTALAADSTLAYARAALGSSLAWGKWQWREAERELTRGIELTPWWGQLYLMRSNVRDVLLEDGALEDHVRGELLHPFSDDAIVDRAMRLREDGAYEQALHFLEPLIRTDTTDEIKVELAENLRALGRHEEAVAVWRSYSKPRPRMMILASDDTGAIRALAERTDAVREPCFAGTVWFELGVDEPYLDCLEWVVRQHHRWAASALRDARIARLHKYPRYQALLRQVNLPPE